MMGEIKNQLLKLTFSVGVLQQEKGKFPSQPQANSLGQHFVASSSVPNPEQAKSITMLRSGNEVDKTIPTKPINPPATPFVLQAPVLFIVSLTSKPFPGGKNSRKVEEPSVPISPIPMRRYTSFSSKSRSTSPC